VRPDDAPCARPHEPVWARRSPAAAGASPDYGPFVGLACNNPGRFDKNPFHVLALRYHRVAL